MQCFKIHAIFFYKTRHPCKPRTIDSEGPRKRNLLWPNRTIVSRTACTFACKSDENWNHNQHMDYDWFFWHFQSWQFAHNKNILCSIPKIKSMSRHRFFPQFLNSTKLFKTTSHNCERRINQKNGHKCKRHVLCRSVFNSVKTEWVTHHTAIRMIPPFWWWPTQYLQEIWDNNVDERTKNGNGKFRRAQTAIDTKT